jgi:phosphatidylglycerophosphate synthase
MAVGVLLLSYTLTTTTYLATVGLLICALLTDFLDGRIARHRGAVTELGYVLDTMGDRAIHLAVLLVFLVRYSFSPTVVWLLIFRDICIYAVRLLSRNWFSKSTSARWASKINAAALRLWLGLFVVRDGFRVFTGNDRLEGPTFQASQLLLLSIALITAYYSLLKSLAWLTDPDRLFPSGKLE